MLYGYSYERSDGRRFRRHRLCRGEVLRLLSTHPHLTVTTVCGHSSVGETLGRHQPHLPRYADFVIADSTAEVLAGHDVVILALPHGKSGAIARELAETSPDTLIVDLAADHRLISPEAWETFYGSTHQGTWTYGLPELLLADGTKQRTRLTDTTRIAVPGCNVTAVTLGLAPLLAIGLIEPKGLNAVLANGVSGAGKALKPHLTAAEILGDASPTAPAAPTATSPRSNRTSTASSAPTPRTVPSASPSPPPSSP